MRVLLFLCLALSAAFAREAPPPPHETYEALLDAADAKLAEKDLRSAAALYAKAAKLEAGKARPLVGLARCAFRDAMATGNARALTQAKTLVKEARERDSEYGGTWFLWGEISLATRSHANAVNGFRGAIVKDHRVRDAKPLLAESLLWHGGDRFRTGAKGAKDALAAFLESREMLELLVKDELYPEAERRRFETLRRKVLNNLAAVYQRTGDLDRALAVVIELNGIAPRDRDYRFSLGLLLAAKNRPAEAAAAFTKALELNEDPDWVQAHRPLGHLASRKNRVEEAERHFAKFLEKRADSLEGWLSYGDHLLRHHRPAEAVTAFMRGVELSPDEPEAIRRLVRALEGAGRDAEARKWSVLLSRL